MADYTPPTADDDARAEADRRYGHELTDMTTDPEDAFVAGAEWAASRAVSSDRAGMPNISRGVEADEKPRITAVPSDHTATTEDAAQRLWQAIDDGLIEGRLTRTDCSLIAGLLATARPGTATAEDESRPVAEVRAEECERLAAEHDRESAERAAASRVAAVRCLRCNLRYEERDQYSCGEPGSGHDYLASEIEDARYVVVEPTYEGDRLRERAAAIRQGAGQ